MVSVIDDILRFIEAAADAGEQSPTNDQIAAAVGRDTGSAEGVIRRMKKAGLISVETAGSARRFTVNGKSTLWSRGYVPLSERPSRGPSEAELRRQAILRIIEEAADAGAAAPTAKEMAARLSVTDETANRALRDLKDTGVIRIDGMTTNRRFTIAASGKQTAWSGPDGGTSSGRLYKFLCEKAKAGAVTPSFRETCRTLRLDRRAVDKAFRALIRGGLVKVDTHLMRRRVIICGSGDATAFSNPGNPEDKDRSIQAPAFVPLLAGPRSGAKGWPAWRTCQWLEGDAKERNFCGEPTQAGSSYCPEHHAVCYTGVPGEDAPTGHSWVDRDVPVSPYSLDEVAA